MIFFFLPETSFINIEKDMKSATVIKLMYGHKIPLNLDHHVTLATPRKFNCLEITTHRK